MKFKFQHFMIDIKDNFISKNPYEEYRKFYINHDFALIFIIFLIYLIAISALSFTDFKLIESEKIVTILTLRFGAVLFLTSIMFYIIYMCKSFRIYDYLMNLIMCFVAGLNILLMLSKPLSSYHHISFDVLILLSFFMLFRIKTNHFFGILIPLILFDFYSILILKSNYIEDYIRYITAIIYLITVIFGLVYHYYIERMRRSAFQQFVEISNLHSALKTANENIKELSGLLPICASCKKVRDDNGYWSEVESYIEAHSSATFSHSICGDCADKLYGHLPFFKKTQSTKKD